MSDSLRQEQPEGIGRKNKPVVLAFALSLLLHALLGLYVAHDAAKDASFALGLNLQPASIDVRLVPAQAKQTPAVQSRSEALPAEETPLSPAASAVSAPPSSHLEGRSKIVKSPRSATARFIDLNTGKQLDLSYWRGAKLQGRPIKIQLTVNPAGILVSWEVLTPGAESLQLDREALNIMVRYMDVAMTGETHVLIWESQVGRKNGELIAKIYLAGDN